MVRFITKEYVFHVYKREMFSKVIFFIWGRREKQVSKKKSLKIIRETILAGTMNLRTTTTGGGQNE